MDLLSAIIECIYPRDPRRKVNSRRSAEDIAEEVVRIIATTEKQGTALQARLQDTVTTEGWTEEIAKAVLAKLQQIIEKGQNDIGATLRDAINLATRVVDDVFQLATDHPIAATVFCTLVAIGVLVLIAPWVIEALGFAELGFAELGPIEGSFAAWWQSTYRGYVAKESLFAFFQRLGMTWP